MAEPQRITSRDNPLLLRLRRFLQDGAAYRKQGKVWLEGEHLCAALRLRGGLAAQAVLSESAWADKSHRALANSADKVVLLPDALFKTISTLDSPANIGFVFDLPAALPIQPDAATLVLDRVQDAGNVGSMLRSAAAFGVTQVLAIKGTAALWSPKVLRAGMGAHFALRLIESLDEVALTALSVPMIATSSHAVAALHDAQWRLPCAWVMGHEGQGVSAALLQSCALQVRIPQPGGEESLNVAAAAAVCLYESARRQAQR
jgi:RNA methyltransferase, TrmH family